MIKALLVDLDDTLLDDKAASRAAATAFFDVHRCRLPDGSFDDFHVRWRGLAGRHWQRFVAGELSFSGQQRARVREALAMNLSDVQADEAFKPHREAYQRAWRCFDDVEPFMRQTERLKKIAVTNGERAQQRSKMVATGLLTDVADLVTPADAGAWKPDAAIFLHAVHVLGVQPKEVMMIGDDHEKDIAPAEKLGIRVFWLRRDVNGLNDVVALLNEGRC
jgi:putative hydrolase of the HAD superfamily